jgi:signal transduction histidine kinase/ActR/RegA family two-component response regulator
MKEPRPHPSDPSERARLIDALLSAGHGVWDWNLRDRTAWYSSEFRALLGVDASEFPDRFEAFTSRLHPEDAGRVLGAVSSHLDGQAEFDMEFRLRTGDGGWKWLRARGRAIRENAVAVRMVGTITAWPLAAARDRLALSSNDRLTAALEDQSRAARELERTRAELLRQNEALRQARAQSEAATESKSMFLANMSHEIRTPMTAILGFLDVLLDESIAPEERANLRRAIRRNSEHLLALINDVLDLTKIEAGGMRVESVPTDALRVVVDCITALRPAARERGLEMHAVLHGPVPSVVHTDPHRLKQILVNLLGNAIKFTSHGGIQVDISREEGHARPRIEDDGSTPQMQHHRLRIAVTDTGIGIEPGKVPALFKPFIQGDDSMTRRFGGTGLGLAISRRLARMLGGDIHVVSEPGRGSVFVVEIGTGPIDGVPMVSRLPEEDATQAPPSPETRKRDRVVRVLVAEDGEDNRRLVTHHLSKAGMETSIATNGVEAIDLALASRHSGDPFHLVLMDMQMPELDGYEATRRLRQEGWRGPIVALTAHAMSGDRERCLEAGCDEYLAKPIDRRRLLEIVQRLASREPKTDL